MTDSMSQQLLQSLKGYFKRDEFSDKVLKIIEIDDSFKEISSITKSPGIGIGKRKQNADLTASPKIPLKKSRPFSPDQSKTPQASHCLSSTPFAKGKKNKIRDKEMSQTPIIPPSNSKDEVYDSDVEDDKNEENQEEIEEVETQKKVFEGFRIYISKSVGGGVSKVITDNGGILHTTVKDSDFIISPYANSSRKKCDTRERTVKWVDDSIKDNELKASFVDVLYRPVQVRVKALSGCILTFDQFSHDDKDNLTRLVECLGASTQELVFAKCKNNSMMASTHLILKKAEGIQYSTAQQWSIPCVTEKWLLKCIETQSKYTEKEFLITNEAQDECFDGIETNNNEDDMPSPYSAFPVHSLILCINSPYFKTLISGSGMKETKQREIIVKVGIGEGRYLEQLIHSFYDQDILKEMEPLDLLKVLEIADRFLCDVFIKRGLVMLKKLNIKSVEQCNIILDHILVFETLGSLSTGETYHTMKQFCSRFLAETFLPLECKLDKHTLFEELSFDSLYLLLKSGRQFLWSENSIIYFIVNWFATDEERQTEENIKSVLTEVRYEQMTPEFLKDVLSPNHTILSKWSNYLSWYIDAMSYHAFSPKSKRLRDFMQARKNRSLNTHKSDIQNCMITLSHLNNGIFKQSWVNYRNLVFQGYVLTPVIIITQSDEVDKFKVKLIMYMGSSCKEKVIDKFYHEFDVAFAIFPGNIKYVQSEMLCHGSTSFINRHYRALTIKFDKKNLDKKLAGTVDGSLFEKLKESGIQASFGFKSSDVSSWPSFMKGFQNLSFNGTLHRKNSQNFLQYDT